LRTKKIANLTRVRISVFLNRSNASLDRSKSSLNRSNATDTYKNYCNMKTKAIWIIIGQILFLGLSLNAQDFKFGLLAGFDVAVRLL
jgi:hypothetical protein